MTGATLESEGILTYTEIQPLLNRVIHVLKVFLFLCFQTSAGRAALTVLSAWRRLQNQALGL